MRHKAKVEKKTSFLFSFGKDKNYDHIEEVVTVEPVAATAKLPVPVEVTTSPLPGTPDDNDNVGEKGDESEEKDSDDEDSAEPPKKKAREELKLLMATSEVKRILKELDECPELQLPRQQKRSAGVTKWNTDCAEIYSPPRITEVASRMKMKRAWALDLTTLDEHGNPWDFSLGNQRKRAVELLERDKPLLLVACPMCGPFSSINDLNYAKMNTEEIQVKLKDAMMHMRFALCLCLKQFAAGRLFMFKHPWAQAHGEQR